MAQPNPLERAILKTLIYGDLFDFPMTPAEIHHFLVEERATYEHVCAALEESRWLRRHITRIDGYVTLRPEIAGLRAERAAISAVLGRQARRYGLWLAYLPYVRMVALTGALAMNNPRDYDDDLDYLVVVEAGRVWLARLFIIGLVRVARLWGVQLCPNYVTSRHALLQSRRDVYIAHELAQMQPLSGAALYAEMRAINAWSLAMLPNATHAPSTEAIHEPRGAGRLIQRGLEGLLNGRLGDWLEHWEQRRKQRKFAAQQAEWSAAAEIDAERVKGHFQDYGHPILKRYQERWRAFEEAAGD